jgi:hypothetical protein
MSTNDPLNNAVYDGIKRGIRVCIENKCFGSAVILVYSGIDAMAFLGMPSGQVDVTGADFISWCNKYIRFCVEQELTGQELYAARCGMLHTYGVESASSRRGHCRRLGYMDRSIPEIRYAPSVDASFALVSIEALANAFFAGIDRCLVDLFADPSRASVAEKRLQDLVASFPVGQ